MNLIITKEFEKAIEHVNAGQSLFLTGKAGTGKSTLLRLIRDQMVETNRQVVTLAPTGVAAINVEGQTIHSFFRFAPGLLEPKYINPWKGDYYENLIRTVQTFIFDEASMMRADMVDSIDFTLKQIMANSRPFGGKQVIFVGDPYQLPPVVADEGEREFLNDRYENEHFFSAEVFDEYDGFPMIELSHVFRQNEVDFQHALEGIRTGKNLDQALEMLNERAMHRHFDYATDERVYIALTNAKVNAINRKRIDDLPGEATEYKARIEGDLKKSEYPNQYVLSLKPGARVMSLINNGYIVNGSIGTIIELRDRSVIVEFTDHHSELEYYRWEKMAYTFKGREERVGRKVKGGFIQLPIRPAYAITSHKSQGQTIDKIHVDLQGGSFAAGQLYVALSRATTLEGLTLKRKIRKEDVKIDRRIRYGIKKRFTSIV